MGNETSLAIELVQDSELREEFGEFVSGSRRVFVKVANTTDLQGLLFAALNAANMPKTGDSWGSDDKVKRLCVWNRTPKLAGWDGKRRIAKVVVAIDYGLERQAKGYPLRGTANVAQIMTGRDRDGSPITVTYGSSTYRVEVPVFAPEQVEVRETTESIDQPGLLAKEWISRTNQTAWMGSDPLTWLVTRIEWSLLNGHTNPRRYRFTWEFQKSSVPLVSDKGGWRYYVIYRRSDGTIPSDANETSVLWHYVTNFEVKFPTVGDVQDA